MDGLDLAQGMEFDAATDSVDAVVASLRSHGVAKVAHVYEPALVDAIAAAAKKIYRDRDFAAAMGTLPEGLQDLHGNLRSIDIVDLAASWGSARELLVTPFARAVAERFMAKTVEVHQWSYARCARANHNVLQLPFHQDMRLLGVPLVNVWIPLSACGVAIPGLEVVAQPLPDLLDTINEGENFYAGIGVEIAADTVLAKFGVQRLYHPAFAPGDALFFQGTTIHRTHVTPAMRRERISIDMRLV
jgi:ectoine hydroxylase-related dioxygenase (phytanoyl-CoA dioxygenase family)